MRTSRDARLAIPPARRGQTVPASATTRKGRGANFDERAAQAQLRPNTGLIAVSTQAKPMSSRDTGFGTNNVSGGRRGQLEF